LASVASDKANPAAAEEGRFAGLRALGFDRERVDALLEKAILGLVLIILVYGPLAMGAVTNGDFLPIMAMTGLVCVLWTARIWLRSGYRFLAPPVVWPVLLFAGLAIFGWWRADIEYYARFELVRALVVILLFFAVLDNLNSQESTQILLHTLVFTGLAISLYAIYQFASGSPYIYGYVKPSSYKGRASGTYVCPNHLAGFLAMVLPVAVAWIVHGRGKATLKILVGYAALMMGMGLAVTLSRGGWISAGVALLTLLAILGKNRNTRLPAIVALALLVAGGGFFAYNSFGAKKRVEVMATDYARFYYWKPAVQMWAQNPWFGVGPNHYDWRFLEFRHGQSQGRPVYTHNDYLNTLADYGATGLGAALAAMGLLAWGGVRTWKFVRRGNDLGSRGSNRSAAVLGAGMGLLALATHSLLDFNMHIPANAITAAILMATLAGHTRFATERHWLNPGWPGKALLSLALLLAAVWLGRQFVGLSKEDMSLSRASASQGFTAQQLEHYKKAHEAQPTNPETLLEIGHIYRAIGSAFEPNYADSLREAMVWLEKGRQLNPWDPYFLIHLGMCLHWLGDHEKATPLFERALQMDPNSYYVRAFYGWHKVQLRDWEGAWHWFNESLRLKHAGNVLAIRYMQIVERLLASERQ